jgi:uncharacterized protein YwgA
MSKVDKFMELIQARIQGNHEVRADRVHEKMEEVLAVEEDEGEREKRKLLKQKQKARARRVRPVTRRK